ncbi:MAG: amino acid ABC transporter permease [Actinomycetota bacterium]|nr:amino acid ABC transporter permease [Actinomycetota bacterium]
MEFDAQLFWDALSSGTYAKGALLAVGLTVASLAAATVLGFALALGRASGLRAVRWLAWVYTWFFRATPTLLQLLFVWYALPQLVPALNDEWFTPFMAAFVALALNEAAYMAEIVRSGLLAVDPGQRLAARALGMTSVQAYRRVIVPQAVRVVVPPTGNEFITLLKLTSLASVISLHELLTVAQQDTSVHFRFAEFYGAALVYYLGLVSVLMAIQAWLERRFTWRTRAARGRFFFRPLTHEH